MDAHPSGRKRRLALVLSGGGARGAYEVGVLSYVLDELTKERGRLPPIDLLCGTSVGAINAVYLAAHIRDPLLGVHRLVDVWSGIELRHVLGFGFRQLLTLPGVLRGGSAAAGVFDVSPIAAIVHKEVPWRSVNRALRSGELRALSISATEVQSGRTVLFIQTAEGERPPYPPPPRTEVRQTRIGPHHALASAAIPFLFPPVSVAGRLYVDGGLRQSTPIAPALRLGASHLLIVGTSQSSAHTLPPDVGVEGSPSATFLLGKVLNALLLDHLDNDLSAINFLNDLVETGQAAYGADFTRTLNRAARERGGQELEPVRTLTVRPSDRLGRLAAEHIRERRLNTQGLSRQLLRWLDQRTTEDADLASYLLFDSQFARRLIDVGRSDARARRAEILAFLEDAEAGTPPDALNAHAEAREFPGWSRPPPGSPTR